MVIHYLNVCKNATFSILLIKMVSGNDYKNEINQLKLLCYLQSDENLSRGSP